MNELPQYYFMAGDRVELTNAGIEAGLKGQASSVFGTVTRTCRDSIFVFVRRDGIKHAGRYHVHYWTKSRSIVESNI